MSILFKKAFNTTERPETIECGSNILSGADPERIELAVTLATNSDRWVPPDEYIKTNVSDTVLKIMLGHN